MKDVYAASCASPFLIHAVDPPCVSHSGKQYVVDLEPVGQPVLSKYGDRKPKLQSKLKTSIRCILQALVILHQAGFAHTDLRWENILWHEGQYVLIDLEFACELNTCPFTPEGHTRKVRPELYQLQWTEASDLILVGDLVEACNVHDLDKQGLEFKTILQAGKCNAEDALTHAWLKC
ncbi:hypothetical protein ABBQ38_014065 [Trebouxia sp. C0009 RCD-2024]